MEQTTCPLTRQSSPSIPQPLWVFAPGLTLTDFTCQRRTAVKAESVLLLEANYYCAKGSNISDKNEPYPTPRRQMEALQKAQMEHGRKIT